MFQRNLGLTLLAAGMALAAPPAKGDLSEDQIQGVIQKFAAKESEFAKAREAYTYRQTYKFHELDDSNRITGRHEVTADIVFTVEGKRTERVVKAPASTIKLIMTPEDEQDLRSVQPFVLTTKDIDKYHVRYLGKETLDEIPCYTFAVKPKKVEAGQRYFSGIVWVDDRDLQIVKSYGRGMGLKKKGSDNQFAKFETFREQIDGKFWFPTYTIANDTLIFESGQSQRIKMTVKYENYKQFKSETTITFGEAVDETKTGQPAQPGQQPPTPPKK